MSNFKAGDKVRVINDALFNHHNIGREGVVTRVEGRFIYVEFETSSYEWPDDDYGYPEDLELIGREFATNAGESKTLKQKLEQIEALVAEVKALIG